MTEINKLNDIKTILVELAAACNISKNKLDNDGSLDYSLNLDDELQDELKKLISMFAVSKKALDQNDVVAVQTALVMARIYAMNLRNFFDGIFEDIEMIGWTDRYNWPKTPENYKIPDHYNYPENKK
ncbi:DUF6853 family protein [Photorhabdus antumapuensis]|uniref:DUF6853 family protein n=1 Tax=Photorhabdus antumapuensis TaxID=2862867 RepID=UPI001CEE01F6|nr:hypothetical protein [Photorhabdus antumapuensis]MCA6222105.1 hypothetical protein [Photorhabdus antumapuensis]